MKALSIKQPFASLIAHGIKDIENRTWKTNFRGRIFIHASAKEAGSSFELLNGEQYKKWDSHINKLQHYPLAPVSAIIGEVDIVDCVINHPSIWAENSDFQCCGCFPTNDCNPCSDFKRQKEKGIKPTYNWVLANPVLYEKPILNVKGKLSFWEFENQKLYFRSIDDNTCHSLEYHMDDAKDEGLEEITLVEAIPDNDNPDYVWCTHYENTEERNQCKKSFCPAYESETGKGICKHRGRLVTFGEEVTFKVQ